MTLRDMVLYCFKDEKSVRIPSSFDDLTQAIRIHHGLAVRSDHRKKQFVFKLHTADQVNPSPYLLDVIYAIVEPQRVVPK